MAVVVPLPRHPHEPGGVHRRDEPGVVGVVERANTHLEVDDVLGDQPRHRGGPDVVERQRGLARRVPDARQQAGGLGRPPRVGRRQRGVRQARADAVPQVELEGLDPLGPQPQHLGPQRLGGRLVVEPDVGCGPPGLVVGLSGDASPGVGLRHPAQLHEAAHPHLLGGAHHDDQVVLGGHALLDEQGHVVHDHGIRARVVDELRGARPDRRVGECLEVAQGGRVPEDHPPERRPVEATVGAEHVRPEPVGHRGQRRRAGLDDLAGHGIRVDHHGAERRQQGRHGRLSGPDSPGEAHAQHVGDPSARARPFRPPGRQAAPGNHRWRPGPSGWA